MSQYDSLNLKVTDLRKGFLLDYDMNTWEVKEEYEYDWANEFYTKEYKIVNGSEERFLSVEVDDETKLALWQKVGIHSIDTRIPGHIMKHEEPMRQIALHGDIYYRHEESLGYWRNTANSNWSKMISWDYSTQDGSKLMTIERWGEEEFEATLGKPVKEFEISNILPRENTPKRAPRDYQENKKKSKLFLFLSIAGLALLFFGVSKCSDSMSKEEPKFSKAYLDEEVQRLMTYHSFSIMLYDMDELRSGWDTEYLHKYLIVSQEKSDSEPEQRYSDWVPVEKDYFTKNEGNLGMELASKKEGGTVNRGVSPPGWGSYVGNEKYGKWERNSSGETFWSFYGKYAFMRSMFGMTTRPIYRNYYDTYYSGYYGSSRAYYGPSVSGSNYYGTNSSYTQKSRPDFFERRQRSRGQSTSSSSSRSSSGTGSSTRSSSNSSSRSSTRSSSSSSSSSRSSRTSRSSNRYSGSSSSRSRSGGFGK